MSFQEIKRKKCDHRFCVEDKYTSSCRICGEKKYKYENFGVKIVLGMFGFDPIVFRNDVDTINYLHDNLLISFAEWYSFMEKESDTFLSISYEEKLKMFRNEQENRIKKRSKK